MSWRELLSKEERVTLPWLGGRRVYDHQRAWKIRGPLPDTLGWQEFAIDGSRIATWKGEGFADLDFAQGRETLSGYLMGDRLIPDGAAVSPDPRALVAQTLRVWLVPPGMERFARAEVVRHQNGQLIFMQQAFPLGPELEVLDVYQDRGDDLSKIAGVTPALHLAFLWLCHQRWRREEARRRLAERVERDAAEARMREALRDARVRRAEALNDLTTAATAALAVSGSELLDIRDAFAPDDNEASFRLNRPSFESLVADAT